VIEIAIVMEIGHCVLVLRRFALKMAVMNRT